MQNVMRLDDDYAVATFEPDPKGFGKIAEAGFRAVVTMQTEGEDQKVEPGDERQLAEAAGLAFHHEPLSPSDLDDATVDGFRRALTELPKPVLLHCTSGKRSGAMTVMHVASERGLSGDEALDWAADIGFSCDNEDLESFVRGYVDRHAAG